MQAKITKQQKGCYGSGSGGQFIHIRDEALYLPVCVLVIASFGSGANAAEISTFETTSVESYVELRYLNEERIDTNAGTETLSQNQTTTEEEYSVLTHNYVYHPSFLKLDLGAGYTLVQDSFETNDGNNDDNEGLYSLYGRASFLEKKPYPVSMYYIRDNPASFPGLAERVQQTNTTYGIDFSLLEPVIPFKLSMFASYNEREGDSLNQIVNDSTDRYGIRATKNYSQNFSQQLTYDYTEDESRSGSRNLPIEPTSSTTDVLTYSSDLLFGRAEQFKYFDYASYTNEDGTTDREEINFAPNLLWKHSDKLRSNYHYNYLDSTVNEIDTTNHNANANLNYIYSDQIEYDAGARYEDNQTTGVDHRTIGVDGRVSYTRPVPNGTLTLSAGLGYDQVDRDADAGETASVIGELVTLSGLTPVALAQDNIITSTIVVQNLAQTQTYILGTDYTVIVVGVRTEIQRLAGSNIGDPETVRVEYDYQTGASGSYNNIKQAYHAGLRIYQYYDLYLDYRRLDQDVSSGNPTLLNSQDTVSTGAGAEYPVNNWLEVGANVDLVKHDEDISPYDSQRYGTYGQFLLPYSSNLRLSANKFIVDNENSDEDVDLTSFSLILRSRPHQLMTLTAEAYTEEDTGGTLFRQRDLFKLTAQWQIYRLRVDAEAVYSNETTGDAETERTRFLITIRRDI